MLSSSKRPPSWPLSPWRVVAAGTCTSGQTSPLPRTARTLLGRALVDEPSLSQPAERASSDALHDFVKLNPAEVRATAHILGLAPAKGRDKRGVGWFSASQSACLLRR
jgi:hypothetical protein